MKALVTGGAGFIGSHIADALIARGDEVHILDNLLTGSRENLNPEARFIEMDIRNPEVGDVFAEAQFDAVFHHAAQLDVRKSVADPAYDADVNILGTLNLLQAAAAAGTKRFIFASTGGAIYGEQEAFPATEEHSAWPASPYGITKLACEKYIHYYSLEHGISYGLMRYSNVYGPRQNAHGEAGVVAIFTSRLLDGGHPVINGDGLQTRDFVHVADVVRANLLAYDYGKSDYFNICTETETTVNEVFHLLNEATGANAPEQHAEAKAGEQRRSVLSYAKARECLGWEPQVSLRDGMTETVRYFEARHAPA